ncbi:RNA polymerase sigma factor [Microbacterium sp. 22195]|uniref:RNA polymerase sigma factor n=1 Tax=Microbacterium sp. 22195 TaxID=3453891 RepID=UPI003F82EF62
MSRQSPDLYKAVFDSLVRESGTRVLRHAERFYEDPHDAEDAVSDAFTRAWQVIHSGGFVNERYLVGIIDNRFKDRDRRERTRKAAWNDLVNRAMSDSERYPDMDLRIDLKRVLSALTPAERELVELMDLDGCSAGETAEKLGIKQAAVRKRHERVHRKLQHLLIAAGIGLKVGDQRVF